MRDLKFYGADFKVAGTVKLAKNAVFSVVVRELNKRGYFIKRQFPAVKAALARKEVV